MQHFPRNSNEQRAMSGEAQAHELAVPVPPSTLLISRAFLVVCLVASLRLAIGLVPTLAQGTPTPIDEYWHRIETTLASIEDLKQTEADAASVRTELDAMAGQLEAIHQVALQDGTVIPIDHSFLVSRLRADPPTLESIEETLRAMLNQRERWQTDRATQGQGISPTSWSQMQRQLDDILSREEFQWQPPTPNPIQEWFNKLLRQALDWFVSLLPQEMVVGGHFMQWIVGGVLTVALLVILWVVVRSVGSSLVGEADLDKQWDERGVITADGALKNAQETARTGDYRSAVRWLYLSSLLILEEHGLLRYDRSRTNREYLRSVAHSPELSNILRDVIDVFDRVWYGFQPIESADYEHYVERVTQLRRLR